MIKMSEGELNKRFFIFCVTNFCLLLSERKELLKCYSGASDDSFCCMALAILSVIDLTAD